MSTAVSPTKHPPYQGVDKDPRDRPGVPRETKPHRLPHSHWKEPPQQAGPRAALLGLPRRTPVFSAALPPRGASGLVRRIAHRIPDHRVSHWMLLLLADRIDVVESLVVPVIRAMRSPRIRTTR
jgi:hypothetical protein